MFARIGAVLALVAACGWPLAAFAQGWAPSRPVRIVIGFPPGGGIDIAARAMAPRLSEALGQPVLVENRPGANGILATGEVARAQADGHTILFGTLGNLSINPVIQPKLPFDMARDFAPLTQVVSTSFLLYVTPTLPVASVAELVAYAKSRPGELKFSSSGNGGAPHLAGEMFAAATGTTLVHVPYKGSSPSITDLMGGHVHLTFEATAIGLPHVRSGKLRALATPSPKRLALLPEVPTVSETVPGFEVVNWFGMVVPAATPADAVRRLHAEVVKALAVPDVREKLLAQGMEPVGSSPDEFGAFMRAETAKWGKVIRDAGIKPD